MHDATLHFCFGVNGSSDFFKAAQVIYTGNQNVFHTANLQVGQHIELEAGSFTFADAAHHFFVPIGFYAQYVIQTPCYHFSAASLFIL